MIFRPYDPVQDRPAVHHLWQEIHWIDREAKEDTRYMDIFLGASKTLITEVNGAAECLVSSAPGSILHLENEHSMAAVVAVTTSLVARKQGLASRLTAQLIAEDAAQGFSTSALGMFEQGYYSRLGFGTGPYEHKVGFNPARLNVAVKAAVPLRLTE
jgi:predicted acetyltransferase